MNHWEGKHGPLLIAEIGGNHEGDFDYAIKLTDLAIDTNVDYIKFQIYTGDTLVNPIESPDRNKHFKKFELSKEQHIQLAERCLENGIGYMASVWDVEALHWINDYIKIYKVGSGDLTSYPILQETCKYKKPILLSTGLSKEEEIIGSVNYMKRQNDYYKNDVNIALLQCTSMYPISYGDANLNIITSLKQSTGLSVGYSDHTEGSIALEVAYAMGADILEFHFTDSRENKTFRDHKVSLTKAEVQELIKKIEWIKELKGMPIKKPLEIEKEHVISFRRALYPSMDIPAGTIIEEKHIKSLRPDHGIPASDYEKLIGMECLRELKKDQKLDWTYFQAVKK